MKRHPLLSYFVILIVLCAGLLYGSTLMGESGIYILQLYMLTPAIAAILTRIFFYEKKFSDAKLGFGKGMNYLKFWIFSILITATSFLFFYLLGAIEFDFTGESFLSRLQEQFAASGQDMYESLPQGFTPKIMMWLMIAGQLTLLNVMPGMITGFGEEFGHRGFMYERMKTKGVYFALIAGGLFWFLWHVPLQFFIPNLPEVSTTEMILNYLILAVGSICSFTYLVYVMEKTQSIWIVSLAHIAMNNAGAAFSSFIVIKNQTLANLGLTITMMIVVFLIRKHFTNASSSLKRE